MKLGIVLYSPDPETTWNAFRLGSFALGQRVKIRNESPVATENRLVNSPSRTARVRPSACSTATGSPLATAV